MDRCIVKNCNFSPVFNDLFVSPDERSDGERLQKWQQALKTNLKKFSVCEQHFEKREIIVKKTLKENAIPNLRLNNEVIKLENDCCGLCLGSLEGKNEIQKVYKNAFKEICGYEPLTDFMCRECKSSLIRYKKFQSDIKLMHARVWKAVHEKVQENRLEMELLSAHDNFVESQSFKGEADKFYDESEIIQYEPELEEIDTKAQKQKITEPSSSTHKEDKKFPCIYCKQPFSHIGDLRHHLNVLHCFSCEECNYTCGDLQILMDHIKENHKGLGYNCKICKRVGFLSKMILDVHRENEHNVDEFLCPYCEDQFNRTCKLRFHIAESHPFCERKIFVRRSELLALKILQNRAKRSSILDNSKALASKILKNRRKKDEEIEMDYDTDDEDEETSNESKPMEPNPSEDAQINFDECDPKTAKCLDCGLHFSVGSLLAHRIKEHPEANEDAEFDDIEKLPESAPLPKPKKPRRKEKLKSREEFLRIVCEHCFAEVREDRLNIHMRDHHSGKSYLCHICSKEFHSAPSFSHHLTLHKNQVLTCDRCGQQKKSTKQMRAHMKTHLLKIDVRKQCKICLKVCDKLSGLKPLRVHMERYHRNGYDCGARTNSETNYFDCYKCGASYANLGMFRNHDCEKGRYQLRCPDCQKPFGNAEIMKAHQKNGCRTKQGNFWKGGRFKK